MKRAEQNRSNYGMNPQGRNRSMGAGKGMNRSNFNSDWNNTDEHFSFDRDSNSYNSNHSDFDDEGLETRSHRMKFTGRDRAGMRSSNPGMQGQNFGSYGYSESYDDDFGQQGLSESSSQNRTGHYGKGPKGYRRSDERIREDVCEALYAHTEIDASEIEVSVKEGLVVLTGIVESRDFKRKVEAEIENLSGVEDVQNDLKVAKASDTASSSSSSSTSSFKSSKLAS
jgi:hypothetical protein